MKITLKDGSVKEYAQAMSVIDIANDISEGLGRAACAGEVNGEVVDLRTVIEEDCELSIHFDFNYGTITLEYNEVGFSPENVFSITGIAEAAKNILYSFSGNPYGFEGI